VQPSEQDLANGAHFFGHELYGTVHHVPDMPALTAGPGRVVVGVGTDSQALVTHRTSAALAELLGVEPAVFPGDHGGFMAPPVEFARTLLRSGPRSAGSRPGRRRYGRGRWWWP
jgi:hypothetical protein